MKESKITRSINMYTFKIVTYDGENTKTYNRSVYACNLKDAKNYVDEEIKDRVLLSEVVSITPVKASMSASAFISSATIEPNSEGVSEDNE